MISNAKCRQCGKEGVTGQTGPFCSPDCMAASVEAMFKKTFGPNAEVKVGKMDGLSGLAMVKQSEKDHVGDDECEGHQVQVTHLTWKLKLAQTASGLAIAAGFFLLGYCVHWIVALVDKVEVLEAISSK